MMRRVVMVCQHLVYYPGQRDPGDLILRPSIAQAYRHRADMLCVTDAGIEVLAVVAAGLCYHWE